MCVICVISGKGIPFLCDLLNNSSDSCSWISRTKVFELAVSFLPRDAFKINLLLVKSRDEKENLECRKAHANNPECSLVILPILINAFARIPCGGFLKKDIAREWLPSAFARPVIRFRGRRPGRCAIEHSFPPKLCESKQMLFSLI
jgi:hypothetical protein